MIYSPYVLAASLLISTSQVQSILGFTPASSARESEIEAKFKSIPSADEERRQHRIFTQEPHVAGSGIAGESLADTRIGSGSDHTVFLNFIGMPVLGLGFEGDYGVYHSAYDDFFWMNHFGDPGYLYHMLISELWGVTALRLANADLLPFDFGSYASNIRDFVHEMASNNKSVFLSGARSNERAESKDLAPPLDFTDMQRAIDDFEAAGRRLNDPLSSRLKSGQIDPKLALQMNRSMMGLERNWLNPDGIPGRPWFKHILYGARYTYAHLELPGLTEAVGKQDWATAKQQAEILERALEKNTELVDELNASLQQK